jgi:TadE-like protein
MVEFALILPLMLFLMAIAIDFGRLFYAYVAVENAAKEGALYGSRNPLCVDNSVTCPDPINVRWHVENEASNLQAGGASALVSQVTCKAPNGNLRQPINDCVNGDTYSVAVSYDFKLITPILSSVLGSGMTLAKTSQAKVIGDAFDPSGIEALVWVNTDNSDNPSTITGACTPADAASSPGFYYAPCQDGQNVNQYLQFPEDKTITFKVRIRNTGNIALTNLSYTYSVNGYSIATPVGCSGGSSLATSLATGAAPSYCSFTLPAIASGGSVNDMSVSIRVVGEASGVSTGDTSGTATVKVVPRPKFTVNLRAAPYRLGGSGYGNAGVASYPSSDLTLQRQAGATDPTLQSPTAWLLLTVSNSGGPGSSFAVSIKRDGSSVALPSDCVVPATLDAGGSFACILPQGFPGSAAQVTFTANATATNSIIVSGDPTVQVTTQDCSTTKRVMPNLVDTLVPSADKSNKTLSQAEAAWTASTVGGTLAPTPNVLTNFVTSQSVGAYTCVNTGTNVAVTTQVDQP